MGKIKGIDVSYYQGDINFTKVANSISFVILREGYRRVIDEKFLDYVKGFTAAKVPIHGVYHFIYATSKAGAIAEAKSCIKNVEKAGLPKTTRIWADLEYDTIDKAKAEGIIFTNDMINEYTLAFCDYVASQGYPTGIYTNNDYYNHYYYKETLEKYPIWLADYTGEPDQDCLYHQYSSSGTVNGISGQVDMDYFLGAEDAEYLANNTGVTTSIANNATTTEKAIAWMESLANDDSHGYDQIYRWGEKGDYDCSSAVITAWEYAGVPVKTSGGATYTGNMYSVFTKMGFEDVTSSVNLATGNGLKRGDILLNHVHHVAMYCGDGKEVEASINEKGGATYGTPGDQTGKEILICNYRNYPWNVVLRYKESAANTTTTTAQSTTVSSSGDSGLLQVGSSGDVVKSLQSKLKRLGYKVKVDGIFSEKIKKKIIHFQKKYGLEIDGIVGAETMSKINQLLNITSDNVVQKVALSAAKTTTTTCDYPTPSKEVKYVGRVSADLLNVRTGPGQSYNKLTSCPQLRGGELIDVCDSLRGLDGATWLYICIGGKIYGFVSAQYVERV